MLHADDFLIAADGGLRHLRRLGLKPHLLIGDLDSVTEADVEWASANGAEVRRYPREKDETDLELALKAAVDTGTRTILVAAVLGGRLDQTLGNLFLLTRPELNGLDVRLEDGVEEVVLIHDRIELHGQAGDIISLLPLNGPALGVTTTALKYPLDGEILCADSTRGISNVMKAHEAVITISGGLLLCIHTRKSHWRHSLP